MLLTIKINCNEYIFVVHLNYKLNIKYRTKNSFFSPDEFIMIHFVESHDNNI